MTKQIDDAMEYLARAQKFLGMIQGGRREDDDRRLALARHHLNIGIERLNKKKKPLTT